MVTKNTLVTGAAVLVSAASLGVAGVSLASANESDSGTSTSSGQTREGRDCGGPGGRGERHAHTEVTGEEATRVTDAVAAQEADITVETVRKDPDGSYDVIGTRAGERVMVEVSADLSSIEVRTAPERRGGRDSGDQAAPTPSASTDATPGGYRVAPSSGTDPAQVPAA
ncbi:MAG: hypothetical protein Q4G43_01585 [Mobilicoccus sp.]|nr:hypothetical protein [Mobilicoccus sp.]